MKSIPYEHIHEPLREWTGWMLEHVKKPRVPVLHVVKDDGAEIIMPESNDINLWLDTNFGIKDFTPEENSSQYKEMEDWWSWCGDIFKHQIDLYKYGEGREFNEEKHLVHTDNLRAMTGKLEARLQDNQYLVGKSMTLADIAIIPFVRQIMRTRNGEFDFSDYPSVVEWAHQVLGTPWFDDIVMEKK